MKKLIESTCAMKIRGVRMDILETNRLFLRKFKPDDWEDLYEYLSLEEVVKYEPHDVKSKEECREEAFNRSKNTAFWAVCLKDNKKLIGNVYFQQQEPKDFMTWELGYVFNPQYYGKGYATEASEKVIEYGFEKLDAHRITAGCNPDNTSSWRVLERLKMRREGYFIKPIFFKRDANGQSIWQDAYQYAILKEEWFKRNK